MIAKLFGQKHKDRKTKIVCTIGPSSCSEKMLKKMIEQGMDFARFNFSHGKIEEFEAWTKMIRQIAKKQKKKVEIIQDLQGPRVRVGKLKHEGLHVHPGDKVVLVFGEDIEHQKEIPIRSDIAISFKKGDTVLMDKGLIELEVKKVDGGRITCKALTGGMIFSGKGLNLPSANTQESFTSKDITDLEAGLKMGVDYIALSFVEKKEDILFIREKVGDKAKIISKIERPQAIHNYAEIVEVSDAVMIARGDLGIEVPFWKLPGIQKRAIRRARNHGVPTIVATDMMASMITAQRPTRAEIMDVANAVLDGASATMLSDETAVGKYPVETVIAMRKIIEEIEDFKKSHELNSLL